MLDTDTQHSRMMNDMMSRLIMIGSVWRILRGTVSSVHDIYRIFLNDEPADYDGICEVASGVQRIPCYLEALSINHLTCKARRPKRQRYDSTVMPSSAIGVHGKDDTHKSRSK